MESTLTYKTYDGTSTIKAVTCLNGTPQEGAPSVPARANSSDGHYSYTGLGWNTEMDSQAADPDAIKDVIADRTVYAAYRWDVRTYTVYWKNSDGTTLETDDNVPWGTTPTYNGSTPQNPTSGGGTFTGWTPAITKVTGNTTYTASYIPVYTVIWYNDDRSTELYRTTVQQGSTATYAGTNPPVSTNGDDYIFLSWDKVTTNVQSNLSVYARYKKKFYPPGFDVTGAYAVQWDYTNPETALSRGGAAASFADPAPATSVSGTGSSPFDNVMPWSGMKKYNVVNGEVSYSQDDAGFDESLYDTVVYIPEFYYAAEKDTENSLWTWSISPTAKTGYTKHPGSGKYIGRYHTSGDSSAVYSKSGVLPLVDTSQTNFRTYSKNKGTGWYMLDLATWSALQMLYLVEFADFNSQNVLGTGYSGTGSIGEVGGTDAAIYHTLKASGAHNQYRWVEDPFSNVRDWIDGFVGSRSETYAAASGSGYSGGKTGLDSLGFALPSSNSYITGFGYSEQAAWAFIPDAASGGSATTFVADYVLSDTSLYPAYVGGSYGTNSNYGMFYFNAYYSASFTRGDLGSRHLVMN